MCLDNTTELCDLVDEGSWLLFDLLNVSVDTWLLKVPAEWPQDVGFERLKDVISSLRVCNDVAERGISMIKDFVRTTKDEEQRQCLLQLVERHREQVLNFSKEAQFEYNERTSKWTTKLIFVQLS